MADFSKTGSGVAFNDQKPVTFGLSRKQDALDAFKPFNPFTGTVRASCLLTTEVNKSLLNLPAFLIQHFLYSILIQQHLQFLTRKNNSLPLHLIPRRSGEFL